MKPELIRNGGSPSAWGVFAWGTLLLAFCGCDSPGKVMAEAKGMVLVDGKPAPGALVTLVPQGGLGPRPTGLVKEDGSFEILTFDTDKQVSSKGAIPGEYGVIVTWFPQPTEGNLESGVAIGDRLKGLYREPEKSKLKLTVSADKPDLGKLELKGPKVR